MKIIIISTCLLSKFSKIKFRRMICKRGSEISPLLLFANRLINYLIKRF